MAIVWTQAVLSTPDVRVENLDFDVFPKKSTREQTVVVSDLLPTDHVNLIDPTAPAGITFLHARVSTTDELAVTVWNQTSSDVDPPAKDYFLLVSRA